MFGTPLRRFARNTADDSPELRRDRVRNNQKLKSRFERIFERYGKDFDGVGDEIDLATGRVVVDNGHIARMQHERDVGSTPSRRFVRAFTQELGGEDHLESRALDHLRSRGRFDRPPRSTIVRPTHSRSRETAEAITPDARSRSANMSNSPDVTSRPAAIPASALVPMMQNNLSSSALDPDAVNSLGNALATQIASFLNQQLLSQLTAPGQDMWTAPPLPEHRLPLFQHGSASDTPGLRSPTPLDMSLWAPREDRQRYHDGRHRHRHRYAESMDRYDSDAPLPSVEYYPTHDYDCPATETQHTESAPYSRFTCFLRDAEYSFHTLAHGFANRAIMTDKEVRRAMKHAAADLPGAGLLPPARPYTLEEDRIIIKLKKRNFNSAQIARYLPGRTEASIAVRYSRALKPGSERFDQKRIIELADDDDTQPVVPLSIPAEKPTEGEGQPLETEIDASAPEDVIPHRDMTPSLRASATVKAAQNVASPQVSETTQLYDEAPTASLHVPVLTRIERRSESSPHTSKKRKRLVSEKYQFTNLSAEQFAHPPAKKKRGRPRKHPREVDEVSVRSAFSGEPSQQRARQSLTAEQDVSGLWEREEIEGSNASSPSRETSVAFRPENPVDEVMPDVQHHQSNGTTQTHSLRPAQHGAPITRMDSVGPALEDGYVPQRQTLPYYHEMPARSPASHADARLSPSEQASPGYAGRSSPHYLQQLRDVDSPFDLPLAEPLSKSEMNGVPPHGHDADSVIPLDPRLLISSPTKPETEAFDSVASNGQTRGTSAGRQMRTPDTEHFRKSTSSTSSTPRLVNGSKASITPINRTLLSPGKRRSGSGQRWVRSASFQPRYSSPLGQTRQTAVKLRPLVIDDSEDDL